MADSDGGNTLDLPVRRYAVAESTLARLPHTAEKALLTASESALHDISPPDASSVMHGLLVNADGHLTEIAQVTQQHLREKVRSERQRLQQALNTRNVEECSERIQRRETHRVSRQRSTRDRGDQDHRFAGGNVYG